MKGYYKVLVQYYSVLQSTTPAPAPPRPAPAAPAPPVAAKWPFYSSFARSTRRILWKGSSSKYKIVKLLQFRVIDAYDLTKGLHPAPQNRNFTTVSRDRYARSYERVHPAQTKSQFYYSFVRSTRTILRKGSSSKNKIAILLQFRAIHTHDLTKGFIQLRQWMNPYVRSCVSIARNCSKTTIPQAFSGPWRPPLKNIMLYLML